jgi:hypothetical protein
MQRDELVQNAELKSEEVIREARGSIKQAGVTKARVIDGRNPLHTSKCESLRSPQAAYESYILNDTFAVLFLGKSERVSQRAGDRSPRL